jgi:hypothetical protein
VRVQGGKAGMGRSDEYAAYLRTPHWRAIRQWALQRAGGACERCGVPADDVHHLTYAHVGAELPADLAALCRPCHEAAHDLAPVAGPRLWPCRICGDALIPEGLVACKSCWEAAPFVGQRAEGNS